MNASDISNTPAKSLEMPRVLPGQVWLGRLANNLNHAIAVETALDDGNILILHHDTGLRRKIGLRTLISSYRLASDEEFEATRRTTATAVSVDGTNTLKTVAVPKPAAGKRSLRNRSTTLPPAETGTVVDAPVAPSPVTTSEAPRYNGFDPTIAEVLEGIESGKARVTKDWNISFPDGYLSADGKRALAQSLGLIRRCASGAWEKHAAAWQEPFAQRWREANAANVLAGQSPKVAAWQAYVDLANRWRAFIASAFAPSTNTASKPVAANVDPPRATAVQPSPTVSGGDLSAVSVPFHDDKILVLWNGQRPWVPVFLVARRVGVGDASVVSRIARRYPDTDVAKLRTALTNDKGFPRISVCVSPEVLHHWLGSVQFSADAATLSVYRAGARDAINTHLGDLFGYVAPAPSALPADEPEAQVTTVSEPANNGATAEPVAPQTCAPDESHTAEEVNAEVCDAPRCDMVRRVTHGQMVSVPFHGDKITAIRDGDDVWIPLRPMCERFGIDASGQMAKLDSSPWACVEKISMQAPGDNQEREVTCLHLRSLAAWLFSIHVGKVAPHLREPLTRYQQEASDVLYRHFLAAKLSGGARPIVEPSVDASRLDRLEQRLVTISEESRRTSELMLASVQAVQQLAAAVVQPRLAQPIDAATAAENARKAEILDERKRSASDRGQDTKSLSRIYPAIRDVYLPLLQQFIGQHLEAVNPMDPKAQSRCVGAGQTKDMFVKWLKEKTSYNAPTEQAIYWMLSDITNGVQIKRGKGVALPFALKLSAVPDPRQTTIPGVGGK